MLVVVGCVIAGVGDLAFDAGAYAFAFSSVITQALYLLLVEFQVIRQHTSHRTYVSLANL
jgi:solute carrier family 35 protein